MSRVLNRVLLLSLMGALLFLWLWPKGRLLPEIDLAATTEDSENLLPVSNGYSTANLPGLSVHFPNERKPVQEVQVVSAPIEVQETGPVFTNEIKYLSSIVKEGRQSWFFKSIGSNRLYELSPQGEVPPWAWVSEESDHFLLKKNDTLFKVRK